MTPKFNDVLARIALALDEPVNDFAEMLRVLRLTANDADDGRTFDWNGGARLRDMFKRGYGPGIGTEINPATIGFFLVAYVLGSPRRTAAERALDLMFAVPPQRVGSRKRTVCPKTGERYFGAALAKVLSDRTLMNDLDKIQLCDRLGMADLIFASDVPRPDRIPLSTFYSERGRKIEPGVYSSACLNTKELRFLPDLLSQVETTAA